MFSIILVNWKIISESNDEEDTCSVTTPVFKQQI